MPESKKRLDKGPGSPNDRNLLESFLGSVENFVGQISAQAGEAAAKGEQQLLIQSSGESLIGQTAKLTGFVRETADRLSPIQRVELDRFLQVQDGEALASRGVKVTGEVLRGGILGNLLHWISQHLKELKKILSEILHLIFDLLHIPYPNWLDKILQILDQLLDLLLSLLSDVFGIGFRVTASQLSEQEVDFLHEWAAFESVRVVRDSGRLLNQEET